MTVSRALSGSDKVSPEIRKKIVARAAELGYVRSAAAATIRGSGSRLVGLVVPNIMNEFYAAFASLVSLGCEREGVYVSVQISNDNPYTELQAVRRLREQDAQLIIIVPTPEMLEETAVHLKHSNVVNFVRTHPLVSDRNRLLVSDTESISEAVDHLVRKGHRSIAYVGGRPISSSGRMRLAAFESALQSHDIEIPDEWIITGEPLFGTGSQAVQTFRNCESKPSALICGGLEISNGALEACLRLDMRMPDDIAFVGFGDPSFYRWIQGGITTISLPTRSMAEAVTDYVTFYMKDPDTEFSSRSFPARLIIRNSA